MTNVVLAGVTPVLAEPMLDNPDLRSLVSIEWTGSAAAMLQLAQGARCSWPNSHHPKDPAYRVCAAVIDDPYKANGKPEPYCSRCRQRAYVKPPAVFRSRAPARAVR